MIYSDRNMDAVATYGRRGGDHINQERLKRIFEFTAEVLFTCNSTNADNSTNEIGTDAAIQHLNDELWAAGYMTWIVEKDGKPCLLVRPNRDDCSTSAAD